MNERSHLAPGHGEARQDRGDYKQAAEDHRHPIPSLVIVVEVTAPFLPICRLGELRNSSPAFRLLRLFSERRFFPPEQATLSGSAVLSTGMAVSPSCQGTAARALAVGCSGHFPRHVI